METNTIKQVCGYAVVIVLVLFVLSYSQIVVFGLIFYMFRSRFRTEAEVEAKDE